MDHRQGKRHDSFSLVKIRCNGRDVAGLVYNCSRQGVYVLSTAAVHKNQYVEILTMDSCNNLTASIPGLVVHHDNSGFGLVFCKPDSRAREFVEKISYRLAADDAGGVRAYG